MKQQLEKHQKNYVQNQMSMFLPYIEVSGYPDKDRKHGAEVGCQAVACYIKLTGEMTGSFKSSDPEAEKYVAQTGLPAPQQLLKSKSPLLAVLGPLARNYGWHVFYNWKAPTRSATQKTC